MFSANSPPEITPQETVDLLSQHSDVAYGDAVCDEAVELTILERLHQGQIVRGFPTLDIGNDFNDLNANALAIQNAIGNPCPDTFMGLSGAAMKADAVRSTLLYVPLFEIPETAKEYQDQLIDLAKRTGMAVVGDYIEIDNGFLTSCYEPAALEKLALHNVDLYIWVPLSYDKNLPLIKHFQRIEDDAKQVGVCVKYVVPKVVRTAKGSQQLKPVNTLLNLDVSEPEMLAACFYYGDIFENGYLLSRRLDNTVQLAVELNPCSRSDLQAELHAIRIYETLALPLPPTPGAPTELTSTGRLTAFTIPTDKPLSVIRAAHGTGKSHNTSAFCKQVTSQGDAVLHILPRTSLVQQARVTYGAVTKQEMVDAESFKDVGSVSNLLFPTDSDGVGNQIAFCVESLAGQGLALGFDLTKIAKALNRSDNAGRRIHLVLDELPSVLTSVLTSDTIQSPAKTMKVFGELLRLVNSTGGCVLALSADLCSTEVDFLIDAMGLRNEAGEVRQDKVFCVSPVVRYPQPYKRAITLSTKKEATIQRIYEAIEHRHEKPGGAVLVMLNSLKVETPVSTINLAAAITEQYPTAKVLVLDSRSKKQDKEAQAFLSATPEEQMHLLSSYDCVLATSIIEAGLNWDHNAYQGIPADFVREIFVIDNGRWGAENILQASMRVRNQAIPCEVFTPKRAHSLERPSLGWYPSIEDSLDYQAEVLENAFAFACLADESREEGEQGSAWKNCYARFVAFEQARKACPRKTLEVLAKANGHGIVLTQDSLPQAQAQAITNLLKSKQEDAIALKAAAISGAITLEGAERVRTGESTLTIERHRAGRWNPASIKERIAELLADNERLGTADIEATKSPAQKAKARKRLASLGYLDVEAQQEFEILNCLSVYGDDARNNISAFIKDPDKQARAQRLLKERASIDERFVGTLSAKELMALKRRRSLSEAEAIQLEKARIAEVCCLSAELTADTTSLTPEQWCRFGLSYQPHLMDRRFLMLMGSEDIKTFGRLVVSQMPQQITAGRVEKPVALLKAAETLCFEGVSQAIREFEAAYMTSRGASSVSFAASCLGVDESDRSLDNLRSKQVITQSDTSAFLVSAMKAGYDGHPGMKLMYSDDERMMLLAELIHQHRKQLSALIPSAMKSIRRSNGNSNAISYLSGVFNDIGLGTLQKMGDTKRDGKKVSVIALVRKRDLLSPAEGLAYLRRKWADVKKQVEKRRAFLDISDF